jgi:organic radical activating enzyme
VSGDSANLVEIFSSVQGEGPHVGARTLFIRFGECDLRCRWCDSPGTWRPARRCRIAEDPLGSSHEWLDNPVDTETVVSACERLDLPSHDFVSLTGGEPLLQPSAVLACARALRRPGVRILLETHGLCWRALPDVVDAVDVVSMDWKLRSDVRRASDPKQGEVPGFDADHERFLRVARRAPGLVVKLVVTPASEDAEIDEATGRVARHAPDALLVLQPVTPCGAVRERPSAERMLALAARAREQLGDVRVIPQTHPIYGAP